MISQGLLTGQAPSLSELELHQRCDDLQFSSSCWRFSAPRGFSSFSSRSCPLAQRQHCRRSPGNCIQTPRTGMVFTLSSILRKGVSYSWNVVFVLKLIISPTKAKIFILVVCRASEAVNDGDLGEDVSAWGSEELARYFTGKVSVRRWWLWTFPSECCAVWVMVGAQWDNWVLNINFVMKLFFFLLYYVVVRQYKTIGRGNHS